MQKIAPCLWYDGRAEEAVNFYASVFGKDLQIGRVMRYTEAGPGPAGAVLTIEFTLYGETFVALNGGPEYQFTPAVSFFVNCETQAEIDDLWAKLTASGGAPVQCGWLTDKFGLSWQIVPRKVLDMLRSPDSAQAARVMQAVMTMIKLDVAALERAYAG